MFLDRLLSRKGEVGSDSSPLSGSRILVVDDEPMVALAIRDIVVELGGCVPAIAHRMEQALDVLEKNEIDCAILDVNLAGTLSYKIAIALRRKNIPFLYCTAHADAASVFPRMATAPRLRKPVLKSELQEGLVRVLTAAKG